MKSILGKSTATLVCSSIIAGAILHLSPQVAIASFMLHNATETLASSTQYTNETISEGKVKLNGEDKFLAIESQLQAPSWTESREPSNYLENHKQEVSSQFLHQLYSLVPGYDDYLAALEEADKADVSSGDLIPRLIKLSEFQSTCAMVADLEAGIDIKARNSESYKGEYYGGAGTFPANFETLLKGCGDENLEHLDELKAEQVIAEAQEAENEKMMEEALAALEDTP